MGADSMRMNFNDSSSNSVKLEAATITRQARDWDCSFLNSWWRCMVESFQYRVKRAKVRPSAFTSGSKLSRQVLRPSPRLQRRSGLAKEICQCLARVPDPAQTARHLPWLLSDSHRKELFRRQVSHDTSLLPSMPPQRYRRQPCLLRPLPRRLLFHLKALGYQHRSRQTRAQW